MGIKEINHFLNLLKHLKFSVFVTLERTSNYALRVDVGSLGQPD